MRLEVCGVDKRAEEARWELWLRKGQNIPLQKPVVEAGLEGTYKARSRQ